MHSSPIIVNDEPGEFHSRPPTRTGARHLQDSSFTLGGTSFPAWFTNPLSCLCILHRLLLYSCMLHGFMPVMYRHATITGIICGCGVNDW